MSEANDRLARLRRKLASTAEPEDRADLEAAIAALEAQHPTTPTQAISGDAQVGVAIAGDAHGDVQSGGVRYNTLNFFQAAGVPQPAPDLRELLASYLDTLVRRCDRLRLTGVVDWERKRGKAPSFTLSQVYVTLAATASVTVEEATNKATFQSALRAGDPDKVSPIEERTLRTQIELSAANSLSKRGRNHHFLERPLLLAEAVSQRRRVVLLGGPGSGKSTFLRYLAVILAQSDGQEGALPGWDAGALLPIYASLGGFAAWVEAQKRRFDGTSLWEYLLSVSEHATLAGLRTELERAFRAGRLLLLLDGLDEVADPTLRAQTAAAVADLSMHSQSYLAVTCRVRSFVGDVAAPFNEWGEPVEVAPFSLGQIRRFVHGWYQHGVTPGVLEADDATRRADALIERIQALPKLRDLAQTPLLLTIITILHFYEGKLPEDRADLYEDLVQLLLTRWTQQRREVGAPPSILERLKAGSMLGGLKEFHLRNVLEELAYRAHQSTQSPDARGLLERGAVREALITLFKQFDLGAGPANEKAELMLDYLEQESGLLLHEGGDRYALPHLTYEEYLAACYLAKQKDKPDFRTLAYQHWQQDATRWREVIFLALGRMVRGDDRDTAAAWLHHLLASEHGSRERDETERASAAIFALECLDDMGGRPALIGAATEALGELWLKLGAAMASIVEGVALLAAERVRFGAGLALLGDPRRGVCTLPPPMMRIAGGTFVIGESRQSRRRDSETNDQKLTLAAFELARYPVTNAQFALFMADDGYNVRQSWWDEAGRRWVRLARARRPRDWGSERFGIARSNYPVVAVSWYEAMAFCCWLTHIRNDNYHYTLPSEAEWEYAARGTEQRMYPWGEEAPDAEYANFGRQYIGTTSVGCFPRGATPEGVLDMAGNVWEWLRSEYRDYPYNQSDEREHLDESSGKEFALRGGSWFNESFDLHASYRLGLPPDDLSSTIGFRLARYRKI